MTREELESLADIRDFTILFESFELGINGKSSLLSMRIAIWWLDLAFHDFTNCS